MLNERILTLNIGASQLALAEFMIRGGKAPELLRYNFASLPEDTDGSPESLGLAIDTTLRAMLAQTRMRPARLMVALSGQMVFPRFVKLMAEGQEKLQQMIRFEAEQNVPFPIDEVVWDYELIGNPDLGEQHAMIVAAKRELLSAVTQAIVNNGLEPDTVDIAPMAIYNAVRFNYPDTDGCMLVVDIGARSTNLVFVELDRVFCRTIPVAGNAITQELAKTLTLSFEEAEDLKCGQAFVAQGGVFAAEDPTLDRISKVVRNVMTRLHAEISRSINFYRSQQGGSAPTAVLLTGGTAQMPYMKEFFEEKLQVEVDFLNPFQNVAFPTTIPAEQFGRDVFNLTDLVGLALRRALTCPIEINLLPDEIVAKKTFRKKVPFFLLTGAGIAAIMLTWIGYANRMASLYENQGSQVTARLNQLKSAQSQLDTADKALKKSLERADALKEIIQERNQWQDIFRALRDSAFDGMWLTEITPQTANGKVVSLTIKGGAWADKIKTIEAGTKPATFVEAFVARLQQKETFNPEKGGKVSIANISSIQGKDWLRSYTITAQLPTGEANARQ